MEPPHYRVGGYRRPVALSSSQRHNLGWHMNQHRIHLRDTKPVVDNKPPTEYSHLVHRSKTKMMKYGPCVLALGLGLGRALLIDAVVMRPNNQPLSLVLLQSAIAKSSA
jgi:hypothetical protein